MLTNSTREMHGVNVLCLLMKLITNHLDRNSTHETDLRYINHDAWNTVLCFITLFIDFIVYKLLGQTTYYSWEKMYVKCKSLCVRIQCDNHLSFVFLLILRETSV